MVRKPVDVWFDRSPGIATTMVAFGSIRRTGVALATSAALLVGGIAPVAADAPIDPDLMDAHVRDVMAAWSVPGVAYAVVRDGQVLRVAAFGTDPDGRPMTTDSPLVIGSVGKSMTALAISQLAAAGTIDLSAPVTDYLPWFALAGSADATSSITIRNLLGHTSGLSTADGQDQRWYVPGLTPEAIARALTSVAPVRPPGLYEYSNLNYLILGVVVEAVSGQSYGEYLREHVFDPLGMDRSATALDEGGTTGGTVPGHRYLFGVPVRAAEPFPSGMVAAGYQVSTAHDMARFMAALANGGVSGGIDVVTLGAPPAVARTLLTDWQPAGSSDPMLTSNQSGATLVTNADILTMPGQRLGVVVLMNANPIQLSSLPAGASELAHDLASLAIGGQPTSSASAPSVRTVYLWVDAILVGLLALLAAHVVRARSWARRLASTRHRAFFLARTFVLDFGLPLAVLIGVPLAIGATGSSRAGDVIAGWRFLTWTLPDLAISLLVLSIVPLMLGLAKLLAVARPHRLGADRPMRFMTGGRCRQRAGRRC